ncbi:MAG: panthothenate synthetase [Gemmatimonadota bacterium]|nr:MAG: panthothenate synthetase [Gemmatimonadota bacterium]
MRMLLHVRIPHEPFNTAVKEGTVGQKMQRILNDTKPEAVYFTEHEGHRGAIMIINLDDPSQVPVFAEPWFLQFNADVEFRIAMTPEDLGQAGLEELGKKWS